MKILVTGATGLLGNNIVRMLLDQQHHVRVLVRASSDRRPLEDLNVEWIIGDLTDAAAVERAVAGVDAVVHSAGYVKIGWTHPDLHDKINRQGTQTIAELARRQGTRLVYVSSINSLGVGRKRRPADESWADPGIVECPYVTSKRAADRVVEQCVERGLSACIVHPGFMLGPWDWKPSSGEMILQVARRWTPLAPWGGISVCDVRDVAAGTLAALDRAPSGSHYVLAGENMTYRQLWKKIADVTGTASPWFAAGPVMRWVAGHGGDLYGQVTGHETEVNSAAVRLSSQFHYFSSRKAERDLGYSVRPVEESIRDAWEWFGRHGYHR